MSGIIGSAGSKSGVIGIINGVGDLSKIGASCRMALTTGAASVAAGTYYLTGYTQDFNDDTTIFTQGSTSTNGITVALAGWYRYDLLFYTNYYSTSGYQVNRVARDATSSLSMTYSINNFNVGGGAAVNYESLRRTDTIYLTTSTYGLSHYHNTGTLTYHSGTTGGSCLTLTYLRA